MNKSKEWYKSKSIIGGLVGIVMLGGLVFGIDFDEGQITEVLNTGMLLISQILAIYGRVTAKAEIK